MDFQGAQSQKEGQGEQKKKNRRSESARWGPLLGLLGSPGPPGPGLAPPGFPLKEGQEDWGKGKELGHPPSCFKVPWASWPSF